MKFLLKSFFNFSAYFCKHCRLLIVLFYLEKTLRIYILDFGVDNYSVFSGEVFGATGLSFSMLLLDSELGLVG